MSLIDDKFDLSNITHTKFRDIYEHFKSHVLSCYFEYGTGVIPLKVLQNYFSSCFSQVIRDFTMYSIFERFREPELMNSCFNVSYSENVLKEMLNQGFPTSWIIQHPTNLLFILRCINGKSTTPIPSLGPKREKNDIIRDIVHRIVIMDQIEDSLRKEILHFFQFHRTYDAVDLFMQWSRMELYLPLKLNSLVQKTVLLTALCENPDHVSAMDFFLVGYVSFDDIRSWLSLLELSEPIECSSGICAYGCSINFTLITQARSFHVSCFQIDDVTSFINGDLHFPMFPCKQFVYYCRNTNEIMGSYTSLWYLLKYNVKEVCVFGKDSSCEFLLPKNLLCPVRFVDAPKVVNAVFFMCAPTIQKGVKRSRPSDQESACTICLDVFTSSIEKAVFQACGHVFCQSCVSMIELDHDTKKKKCPSCRKDSYVAKVFF